MLLIDKRIGRQRMSIAVRDILDSKNKALLTAAFTNRFGANSTGPGTVRLPHESEVPLTLAYDLSLLITLDRRRQLPGIPGLLTVVGVREGRMNSGQLARVGDDNIKALGHRVRNQTTLTLIDRGEDLSGSWRLNPCGREGIDGLLNNKSKVFWAIWVRLPSGE